MNEAHSMVTAVQRLARCRHPARHVVELPLRGELSGHSFVRYQCVRCGSCRVEMGDNPGRWDRPLLVRDVIEASR